MLPSVEAKNSKHTRSPTHLSELLTAVDAALCPDKGQSGEEPALQACPIHQAPSLGVTDGLQPPSVTLPPTPDRKHSRCPAPTACGAQRPRDTLQDPAATPAAQTPPARSSPGFRLETQVPPADSWPRAASGSGKRQGGLGGLADAQPLGSPSFERGHCGPSGDRADGRCVLADRRRDSAATGRTPQAHADALPAPPCVHRGRDTVTEHVPHGPSSFLTDIFQE